MERPDIGLMSITEMFARARNIVAVVDAPAIADADTEFGIVINVIRTDPDFLIMAPTVAKTHYGIDTAIDRGKAYERGRGANSSR